jgi:hypothetical protein
MHHFGSWKLTLLLVIATLFTIWTSSPETIDLETRNINRRSFQYILPQCMELQNTDVYYKIPQQQQPHGVLIFFHGCNHDGRDLFLLPEDRLVVKAALDRNLAVLSITSKDRETGCWSDLDVTNVRIIVKEWLSATGLSNRYNLPRIGMGASSGGSFLFRVYGEIQLISMASYISPAMFENPSQGIPTIFVHMPHDIFTGAAVQRNHATLEGQGIASHIIPIDPHPLTPELCTERILELDRSTCQKILEKAMSLHYLDANYTVLRTDALLWSALVSKYVPRRKHSRTKSEQRNKGHIEFSWLERAFQEEVTAAFAYHEMTAENIEQVMDFLITHAGI